MSRPAPGMAQAKQVKGQPKVERTGVEDRTGENRDSAIGAVVKAVLVIVVLYAVLSLLLGVRRAAAVPVTMSKKEEDIEVSASGVDTYTVELNSERSISSQILVRCTKADNVDRIDIYGVTPKGDQVYVDTFPTVVADKDLDFHDLSSKYAKYLVVFVAKAGTTMDIMCKVKHNRIEVG